MCVSQASVTVGDSYDVIIKAFEEQQVASLARVIMINPLHQLLPAIQIYMMPTCNRFTAESVRREWNEIKALYNQHILPVLGPLIGEFARYQIMYLLKLDEGSLIYLRCAIHQQVESRIFLG